MTNSVLHYALLNIFFLNSPGEQSGGKTILWVNPEENIIIHFFFFLRDTKKRKKKRKKDNVSLPPYD